MLIARVAAARTDVAYRAHRRRRRVPSRRPRLRVFGTVERYLTRYTRGNSACDVRDGGLEYDHEMVGDGQRADSNGLAIYKVSVPSRSSQPIAAADHSSRTPRNLITTDCSSTEIHDYMRTMARTVNQHTTANITSTQIPLPRLAFEIIKCSPSVAHSAPPMDGCRIHVYRDVSASDFAAALVIGNYLCKTTGTPAVRPPLQERVSRLHLGRSTDYITAILFKRAAKMEQSITPLADIRDCLGLADGEPLVIGWERDWSPDPTARAREEGKMETLRHLLSLLDPTQHPDSGQLYHLTLRSHQTTFLEVFASSVSENTIYHEGIILIHMAVSDQCLANRCRVS